MLHMVGKIFLWGVCFAKVYNEQAHENMQNLEKTIFPPRVQKKISIILTQRWSCTKLHFVMIHIFVYQVRPFKFRLLFGT